MNIHDDPRVPNCKFSPTNGSMLHEAVGVEALRRDPFYRGGWAFNPWNGQRRAYGDVEMDPQCRGVWEPEWGPMRAQESVTGCVPTTIEHPCVINNVPRYVKAAPSALDVQEGGDHYKTLKIQPVEYIHANGLQWAEGTVVKYVTRWRAKGGIEDLKKARHVLDLLIELEEKR